MVTHRIERVAERQAVEGFEEPDGVAGPAAAGVRATPEASGRGDDQARLRLGIVVEWTAADPVPALRLEGNAPGLDEGDKVGFGGESLDVGFGGTHDGMIWNEIGWRHAGAAVAQAAAHIEKAKAKEAPAVPEAAMVEVAS